MQKQTTHLAFISASIILAGFSLNAAAADGSIRFDGHIMENICTTIIAAPGSGTPGSATVVNLPSVTDEMLNSAVGTYAGHTAFTIQLTCYRNHVIGNVRTSFTTSTPAADDNTVMGNIAPSGSADVAVAILTPENTPVHLNGGTFLDPGASLSQATPSGTTITLNYQAAYKSLSTTVTPGPVTAVADYVISYF
ncbi:major type 1 subunit fimbrin (pilin) [Raoultella sp. BIGb0138]|uniref:fimbrial protein n=1 Tax=Raoultella sp. BIGb0138 TaxID=2485115 RepID=UPI0010D9D619|nr:fimbrial protein [Raoultella sp. BIGb0138]TCW17672.1 major type 1 subunit fimbrin (pilin) [Raoultella sp. BIGb0138]